MSSDAQNNNSIDPIGHRLIYATCLENADLRDKTTELEEEVQLWQHSMAEKAQENTQLVSELRRSQKAIMDLQASINNMDIQVQQQAAVAISIKKQTVEMSILKERGLRNRRRVKKELGIMRQRNAQSLQFAEVLNFTDRRDLEDYIGDNAQFDDILAGHPTIARHMEHKNQENAAKAKVLEKYKGTHQQLCSMLQKLLVHHAEEYSNRV